MSSPRDMRKGFTLVVGTIIAVLIGLALVLFTPTSASATGGHDNVCIPQDAWTETIPGTPGSDAVHETVIIQAAGWQRYSYNGAWPSNVEAPAFPGDSWQANTASDPHGVGAEGAYFRSNGNSGHGDWFYLVAIPEITERVLVSDAVPATPDSYIDHPAVECEQEPADVCLNIDGIQETIPEGMEAGPATEYGPTCVEADTATPGGEIPVETTPPTAEEPTLPRTGPSELLPLIAAAGVLLLSSGVLMMRRRRA